MQVKIFNIGSGTLNSLITASIACCLILCAGKIMAQENKTVFIINKTHEENNDLTSRIFKYKQYTDGKIIFKDNEARELKMNYNQLSDQVLFINPGKDTLEFAEPEKFNMLVIGKDSFYFYEGKYLEKITHFTGANLVVNQKIKFLGIEKKGAYGTYSASSAISSTSTFKNNNNLLATLEPDQNAVFIFNDSYFISDKYNNFFQANKKNIYKAFPGHEKDIKNFLNDQHVNFSKKHDLEQLLQYMQGLE